MLGNWLARYQPEWIERLRLGAPVVWIGPTGRLALVINQRWRSENIFVQLVTKIDEANTHDGAAITTVAGYVGRLGQWQRFDKKWRKELHKAGLTYFHAVANSSFTPKAPGIADAHLMAGFVVRLDRKDFEEVYRSGPWGGKAQPDSMYGLCFRYLLSAVLEIGVSEYKPNLRLDFIIESGHPNEGAPNDIVRRLKKQNISGVSEYLGTVTPMLKKESYGLQAADGLATGAAWAERPEGSIIPVSGVLPAGTLAEARAISPLKVPLFRCHVDRDQLAKFRDDTFALVEFRRQHGARLHAEYQARKGATSSSEQPP